MHFIRMLLLAFLAATTAALVPHSDWWTAKSTQTAESNSSWPENTQSLPASTSALPESISSQSESAWNLPRSSPSHPETTPSAVICRSYRKALVEACDESLESHECRKAAHDLLNCYTPQPRDDGTGIGMSLPGKSTRPQLPSYPFSPFRQRISHGRVVGANGRPVLERLPNGNPKECRGEFWEMQLRCNRIIHLFCNRAKCAFLDCLKEEGVVDMDATTWRRRGLEAFTVSSWRASTTIVATATATAEG